MEVNFEKVSGFVLPSDYDYSFLVIGAGGTGGHLIPNLARMISLKNEEGYEHTLTLVDSDEVEHKNLARQQFTIRDIGKNKAEVLASRYGKAFNVNIGYYEEYVESPLGLLTILDTLAQKDSRRELIVQELIQSIDTLDINEMAKLITRDFIHRNNRFFVIIDCTDNNKTRLIIHETVKILQKGFTNEYSPIISLSSGNEEHSGQVIFSVHTHGLDEGGMTFRHIHSLRNTDTLMSNSFRVSFPDFFDVFPNAKMDKLPSEMSCAEAAVSAPQNISANINAANILFDYCNKLLSFQPIYEMAVFFNNKTMTRSTYQRTYSGLKQLLSLVPNNVALNDFSIDSIENPIKPPTWKEVVEKKKQEEKELQEKLKEEIAKNAKGLKEKEAELKTTENSEALQQALF